MCVCVCVCVSQFVSLHKLYRGKTCEVRSRRRKTTATSKSFIPHTHSRQASTLGKIWLSSSIFPWPAFRQPSFSWSGGVLQHIIAELISRGESTLVLLPHISRYRNPTHWDGVFIMIRRGTDINWYYQVVLLYPQVYKPRNIGHSMFSDVQEWREKKLIRAGDM